MTDVLLLKTIALTLVSGMAVVGFDPSNSAGDTTAHVKNSSAPIASPASGKKRLLQTHTGPDGRLHMAVEINHVPVVFMVDTAATHTVLNRDTARLINAEPGEVTKITTAGGMATAGKSKVAQLNLGDQVFHDHEVLIVDDLPMPLLGMDILQRLDGSYIAL